MRVHQLSTDQISNGGIGKNMSKSGIFWWIRQIFFSVAGCFFLLFGIHLLIAAYRLNHPFHFVMTFFASNLIILISGALLAGFILKMIKMAGGSEEKSDKIN